MGNRNSSSPRFFEIKREWMRKFYKDIGLTDYLDSRVKPGRINVSLNSDRCKIFKEKEGKNMKQEKEFEFGLCEDSKIEGVDKYLLPKNFFEEYDEFSFEEIHSQIIKSLRKCKCDVTDSITVYVNGPIPVLICLIRICITNVMSLKLKYYNNKTDVYDVHQYVHTDMWKPELKDGGHL